MKDSNTYTHQRARNRNISIVLKLICTGQANTRSDLSRMAGLSKMTLSNIVTELLNEEYVCETDRSNVGVSQGRKPIALEVSPNAPYVVGIFVGRFECSVVISTIRAQLVRQANIPMSAGMTGEELLDRLYKEYQTLTSGLNQRILGIGVASIGPIDRLRGIILNPPDFFGIRNLAIRDFFEERTGLPVFFHNNMNAAVLAEKLFGHGKEISNLLYLGVTHGVGAGVISGGKLLEGPTGINGEVGHTSINFDGAACQCGSRGCLELYASIPRVVESAVREMTAAGVPISPLPYDWQALVDNARKEEYYSLRALERLCEYLAVGIVNLVNLFDCEEIFLGHELALAKGLVERQLEDAVNQKLFARDIKNIRIRMSAFGTQAPLIGSVCLVLDHYFGGGML